MKLINRIVCLVLAFSTVLLTGYLSACSSPRSDFVEMPIPTPSNTNSGSKKYTEFINNEGWHVPLPPEAKKGPKSVIRLTSASGAKVDVVVTVFVGFSNYHFTYGSMTEEQKDYLGQGGLKLVALKELRIGRNVYAYVILAEKAEADMKMSGNESRQHPFFYRIFDRDGDGKFETLFPGNSDNLVPEWASK